MGATETAPCTVSVDREGLSASLVFDQDVVATGLTRDDLVEALNQAKIEFTPGLGKRIDELAAVLRAGKLPSEPVLMARGRPADPGKDGWFELNPELQPEKQDQGDRVDFYEQNKIITVTEGQVVGKIHPALPSKPGEDVFGRPIKPKGKRREVELGKNIRVDNESQIAVATCDGRVDHGTLKVAVLDILEVAGDVDFNSGNVDSASDILVRGTVLDLFCVKSKKSVEVGGCIEAAQVYADANILVRGGICGKEKGKVTCGGELRAKYCDSVQVEVEGNIHIAKEAINCDIRTNAVLSIAAGSLIGGKAHARNGAEIKVIGSDAGVNTHLGVGMDPGTLVTIRQIDQKAKSLEVTAQRIRTTVKPMMDNLRKLTPDQREKATELVFQADELDAQKENLLSKKEALLNKLTPVEGASVLVTGRICEGVTITVDNYSLRFDKDLKGPVKIERRKIDNVTEIVSVSQVSGSVTVMPARKIELPSLEDSAQADA